MIWAILKTIVFLIIFIFSGSLLLISFIDFIHTGDFIDIMIFIVFFILFVFSSKYLFKHWKQKNYKQPSIGKKLNQDKLEKPLTVSKYSSSQPICSPSPITSNNSGIATKEKELQNSITFPDWYISISFGKSSSDNYLKAVSMAKSAPQYLEQTINGKILHQAVYSPKPNEYLSFIMLYELVKTWKSTFVMINGQLIDRKIIGQLNYCYGDKCRSGNPKFCYGASYMTDNPFGCHRLQISACNNPWWSYYQHIDGKWILDKETMLQRINSYATIYSICPVFDYDSIIAAFHKLPTKLSDTQYKKITSRNI